MNRLVKGVIVEMRTDDKRYSFLKKMAQGVLLSIGIVALLFAFRKEEILGKLLLYETLPYTNIEKDVTVLFKYNSADDTQDTLQTFADTSTHTIDTSQPPVITPPPEPAEPTAEVEQQSDVIGTTTVIYQDEASNENFDHRTLDEIITAADIEKLKDISYLKSKFYLEDQTMVTAEDFDVTKFIHTDLRLDTTTQGPKVLIIHTHIDEMYSDSDPNHLADGVMGVGDRLAQELEQTYGIPVLHHRGIYDKVEGKYAITGAYERMEAQVEKIIAENPSLEVVIDIHRDGFDDESKKLLTQVDGKPTAQIMFFNGLSKIYKNGTLENITSLPNPYLPTNLAMSFNMQLVANAMYPGFTRKVYLKPYRYSLHMLPKSMLIEVGAQTNTKEEAFNTAKPLAKILAEVLQGNRN